MENLDIKNDNDQCSNYILVGTRGGKVLYFDTTNMKVIECFKPGTRNSSVTQIINTNNKYIIGIFFDKVRIFNERDLKISSKDFSLMFSNDIIPIDEDQIAISSGVPKELRLYNMHSNKFTFINKLDFNIQTLCLANKKFVILGCDDGLLRTWNIKTNKFTRNVICHSNELINSIIKMKLTGCFASSGWDDYVKMWSIDEGRMEISELTNKRLETADVIKNEWSKLRELTDGRLAHCTKDFKIKIWDIRSLNSTTLEKHTNIVYDFLNIDQFLLSCSADKNIHKWDLRMTNMPCVSFTGYSEMYRFENFYD